MSDAFSSGTGDGLLGLAFGNINTVTPSKVPTPVTNMGTQGAIPPVFSPHNFISDDRVNKYLQVS